MEIRRPESKQPIPPHAKCVFKGRLFHVYQWEQKMFDGSIEIFEKLKRPDTVVVLGVLADGKILLTEQEQPGKAPFIAAAGGRVDEGEDVLAAAKRELLEETGHEAKQLILWKAEQPISKIDWAVYIFIGKGLKKVADLHLDAGEKIKLMPVSFDELVKIATSSGDDKFYEKEVVQNFFEARLDPKKMAELMELFKPI